MARSQEPPLRTFRRAERRIDNLKVPEQQCTTDPLFITGKPRKPRRRGTARLFVLGGAFVTSAAASAGIATPIHAAEVRWTGGISDTAQAQDSRTISFAIPAAPLADVLAAFEQLTRIKVVLTNRAIAGIQSPGVTGTFMVQQALNEILSGTSVAFSFTAADAVTLDLRAPGEFIAVTGERPGPIRLA